MLRPPVLPAAFFIHSKKGRRQLTGGPFAVFFVPVAQVRGRMARPSSTGSDTPSAVMVS